MPRTTVILLGTGSPSCLPHAYQSATVIIIGDRPYLIDCGGGVVQRIAQAAQKYRLPQLNFPNLNHLFITHLHPDHTVGLPDFLIAPWVKGREGPIHIYGPEKTEDMVTGILRAFEPGIAEHLRSFAPITGQIEPRVSVIRPGIIFRDEQVEVAAFPVSHGELEAYGLKFITADVTIVISGDTKPVPELVEQAAGCDLLIHEVYNTASLSRRSSGWKNYFYDTHTSSQQLSDLARKIRPKLLVTTHNIYFPPETEESTLKEITAGYDGAVIFGRDLDRFDLN